MQLAVIAAAIAGLLLAIPAMAQQPVDQRLVAPAMTALQAMLALREAEIKALTEDFRKREAEWAEYSKPLWQAPAKKADTSK